MSNLKDVVFDCADAWTLSHWWADVLGYQFRAHTDADLEQLRNEGIERVEDDPNLAIDPVGENGPSFWFCKVPEAKSVKNRVHIDVYGDADELIARGAILVEAHERWTVLADP